MKIKVLKRISVKGSSLNIGKDTYEKLRANTILNGENFQENTLNQEWDGRPSNRTALQCSTGNTGWSNKATDGNSKDTNKKGSLITLFADA